MENKQAFTAGPWSISKPLPNGDVTITHRDAPNTLPDVIARIHGGLVIRDANAQLIAQAPAMLESLKQAAQWLRDYAEGADYPLSHSLYEKADRIKAAIEAATGEPYTIPY